MFEMLWIFLDLLYRYNKKGIFISLYFSVIPWMKMLIKLTNFLRATNQHAATYYHIIFYISSETKAAMVVYDAYKFLIAGS